MKKSNKYTALGMSLGMCFGCSIGLCFGLTVFDNMALGMCMGVGVGMALGMALGSARDAAVNKQLEEKGYTVKSVEKKADSDKFTVVIADRTGAEQSVTVDKDIMSAEQFREGDVVCLGEHGIIEKVFGDEAPEDKQSDKKK